MVGKQISTKTSISEHTALNVEIRDVRACHLHGFAKPKKAQLIYGTGGRQMKLEIDVFDYLSPEKITEIAEDELRRAFSEQFRKEADVERVLSNLTAEYVFKLVESEWASHSLDFEKALRERIDSAIRDDSVKYYVFRRKDVWDRTESPAVKILDDECANSRPLIREMVEKHIREYPFHELDRDEIGCVIYDVIMNKILNRRANHDER